MGAFEGNDNINEQIAHHVLGSEPDADFDPSGNIAHAWRVVAAINAKFDAGEHSDFYLRRIDNIATSTWTCTFANEQAKFQAHATTAEMAICLAALKALGVVADETPNEPLQPTKPEGLSAYLAKVSQHDDKIRSLEKRLHRLERMLDGAVLKKRL